MFFILTLLTVLVRAYVACTICVGTVNPHIHFIGIPIREKVHLMSDRVYLLLGFSHGFKYLQFIKEFQNRKISKKCVITLF